MQLTLIAFHLNFTFNQLFCCDNSEGKGFSGLRVHLFSPTGSAMDKLPAWWSCDSFMGEAEMGGKRTRGERGTVTVSDRDRIAGNPTGPWPQAVRDAGELPEGQTGLSPRASWRLVAAAALIRGPAAAIKERDRPSAFPQNSLCRHSATVLAIARATRAVVIWLPSQRPRSQSLRVFTCLPKLQPVLKNDQKSFCVFWNEKNKQISILNVWSKVVLNSLCGMLPSGSSCKQSELPWVCLGLHYNCSPLGGPKGSGKEEGEGWGSMLVTEWTAESKRQRQTDMQPVWRWAFKGHRSGAGQVPDCKLSGVGNSSPYLWFYPYIGIKSTVTLLHYIMILPVVHNLQNQPGLQELELSAPSYVNRLWKRSKKYQVPSGFHSCQPTC